MYPLRRPRRRLARSPARSLSRTPPRRPRGCCRCVLGWRSGRVGSDARRLSGRPGRCGAAAAVLQGLRARRSRGSHAVVTDTVRGLSMLVKTQTCVRTTERTRCCRRPCQRSGGGRAAAGRRCPGGNGDRGAWARSGKDPVSRRRPCVVARAPGSVEVVDRRASGSASAAPAPPRRAQRRSPRIRQV